MNDAAVTGFFALGGVLLASGTAALNSWFSSYTARRAKQDDQIRDDHLALRHERKAVAVRIFEHGDAVWDWSIDRHKEDLEPADRSTTEQHLAAMRQAVRELRLLVDVDHDLDNVMEWTDRIVDLWTVAQAPSPRGEALRLGIARVLEVRDQAIDELRQLVRFPTTADQPRTDDES